MEGSCLVFIAYSRCSLTLFCNDSLSLTIAISQTHMAPGWFFPSLHCQTDTYNACFFFLSCSFNILYKTIQGNHPIPSNSVSILVSLISSKYIVNIVQQLASCQHQLFATRRSKEIKITMNFPC